MKIPTQKGEHSANVQSCPYNEKRVLLYMHVAEDNWAVVKGCDSNVKVKCSNLKVATNETTSLHQLLVIVIIVFKHYPSTYCLMQVRCLICSNF